MGATWALFLVLGLPWGHEQWEEMTGVTTPVWEPNPEPAYVELTPKKQEQVKDFVTRVREARETGKDAAEQVWGCRSKTLTKKDEDLESRKIIQDWQKRVMASSRWQVTRVVHDALIETNNDYWAWLKVGKDKRSMEEASKVHDHLQA